jgi:hypothetical protein
MQIFKGVAFLFVLFISACVGQVEERNSEEDTLTDRGMLHDSVVFPDFLKMEAFDSVDSFSFYYEPFVVYLTSPVDTVVVGSFLNKLGMAPSVTLLERSGSEILLLVDNTCFDLGYRWEELSLVWVDLENSESDEVCFAGEVGLFDQNKEDEDILVRHFEWGYDLACGEFFVVEYSDLAEGGFGDRTWRAFPIL